MLRIYVKNPAAPVEVLGLELTFNVPVADASSVSYWNTFFDLPTNGSPFTSVEVVGDMVKLIGGSELTLKDSLFYFTDDNGDPLPSHLILFEDKCGCIISAGQSCFNYADVCTNFFIPNLVSTGYNCFQAATSVLEFSFPNLLYAGDGSFQNCNATNFNLPKLITAGVSCFEGCIYVESISLPLLTDAGESCFYRCFPSLTQISLPSLVNADLACFMQCENILEFDLPLLTQIGNSGFQRCIAATVFNLPSLINSGSTVGNNSVFYQSIGKTITLTIPSALMTCNGGNPDGDISYLQANNTVTIVTV